MSKYLFALAVFGSVASAVAAEEADLERSLFGKWRISFGGAFNGGISADLHSRNLPVPPSRFAGLVIRTREDALASAVAHEYDGGGFIRSDDSLDSDWRTENWKLPVSSYYGNGLFVLDNSYQQVVEGGVAHARSDSSDDDGQFGLSLEASRELWVYDEEAEHRWGVDFAAAISYFFRKGVYDARGTVTRNEALDAGTIRTVVNDPDAMYKYDRGRDNPVLGMYGYGNEHADYAHPALLWENVGQPFDTGTGPLSMPSTAGYVASGDYRELEFLFMFRPWYEVTDWWRIYANAGLGVSWGNFETSFDTPYGGFDEDFSQWDAYGVAGVGTMFRYEQFDISVDFLGRFLRDDMDVDGRNVTGSLSRADWGFRVMVGYEF